MLKRILKISKYHNIKKKKTILIICHWEILLKMTNSYFKYEWTFSHYTSQCSCSELKAKHGSVSDVKINNECFFLAGWYCKDSLRFWLNHIKSKFISNNLILKFQSKVNCKWFYRDPKGGNSFATMQTKSMK